MKAHSCYFLKDAYADITNNGKFNGNKELIIIPDAVHTALYDNLSIIPFDKIESFFNKNM